MGYARRRQERAAATLAAGGLLEGAARGAAALPPADPALARLDHVMSAACAGAAAAAAHRETLDLAFRTRTGFVTGDPAAHGAGALPSQPQPGAGSGRGGGAGAGGAGAGRLGGPGLAAELAGEGPRLWRATAALAVLEAFQVGAALALVADCPCLVSKVSGEKLPAGGSLMLRCDASWVVVKLAFQRRPVIAGLPEAASGARLTGLNA